MKFTSAALTALTLTSVAAFAPQPSVSRVSLLWADQIWLRLTPDGSFRAFVSSFSLLIWAL